MSQRVTPVVSVIMPTWNGERFLRPAIDSLLNQTFTDFELIVIDDGSTDRTPHILADYKDARLIVLTNEHNLGIAGATNRGLHAARGEYIALQDHDDISLPHRLQTQVEFLDSHSEISLVGSAATLINDDGVPYAEFPLPCEEIDIKWRLLFFGDAFHYSSIMVRHGAMREIGGYGEDPAFRYSEAYDPFSRLAMCYRMANLPDKLLLWRRHPDATSLQNTPAQTRSGEIISLRNISTLSDHTHGGARHDDQRYLLLGFKAFTSTPAGQLPVLPAEQVVSGLKFCSDIQETFYRAHKFSRFDVARHRKPLNWAWGKHAVALAVRAPWGWRPRIRGFMLGLRCLRHAAWAALVTSVAKLIGHSNPCPNLTVPTIRAFTDAPEQPTWTNKQLNVR
jgi:glycosyltransferase involved in cell wall biosynthesis